MKRIVHYDDTKPCSLGKIGGVSWVYTVDHSDLERVSNTSIVRTSTIVSINGKEFETLNSVYKPVSELLKSI